jgi:hypothetical protein
MNIIDPEKLVFVDGSSEKWYGEHLPAFCSHCNQSFFLIPNHLNQYCPICLETGFEIHPILTFSQKPELILPFRINHQHIESVYKRFLENFWFKPDDLTPFTLLSRASFHYWIMWLVDSQVDGFWKAEMGFDYKLKSSVESFNNQTWDSKEEIHMKIRWESRMGEVHRMYQNMNLPALSQHGKLVRMIGDFDLKYSIPVSEFELQEIVITPELNPQHVWDQAKMQLDQAVENDCEHACDAQHIRGFSISAEYNKQNWTMILLPYIVSYYLSETGDKTPVYINGQSGRIYGSRFASTRKALTWTAIGAIFAFLLFISGILALTLGSILPPLPIIGFIFLAISLIIGFFMILPPIWTLFHNKQEKETAIYLRG